MKKYAALVLLLFITVPSFALHIAGGELFYRYVGPGTAPNTDRYSITLRLFRECNPVVPGNQQAAPMPREVELGIFANTETSGTLYKTLIVNQSSYDEINLLSPLVCIVNPPDICYQIGYFNTVLDLPKQTYGYTVAYQTCCRSFSILNITFFSIPGQQTSGEGATYTCSIPGTSVLGPTETNSSAVFEVKDTVLVCQQKKIRLDFSATDPDSENPLYGDSLSYAFCNAYNRGAAFSSGDVQPSNPPYQSVTYNGGYSGFSPMGDDVVIDPKTGIITGTIGAAGGYVVTVCVTEWRHGVPISVHRKDFLLRVAACDFAAADLEPKYITCDGYSLNFKNESTSSAIKSYYWEFGENNANSTQPTPTYTYGDTGLFNVKLVVNRGQQCSDSTTTIAAVYPGFKANFGVLGNCLQTPYLFRDSSTTVYGAVDTWTWAFGDGASSDSTNPTHRYANPGTKTVILTVTNTKGCTEAMTKTVEVRDKPLIMLPFKDTLICNIDTLQLAASTSITSSYAWLPNSNITNPNSQNPLVYPNSTTTYYVSVDDGKGCTNTDSVLVSVTDHAFITLGNDTTICLGDTMQINPATTNALYFSWTPASYLNDATSPAPYANPPEATHYTVTASISKNCVASDDIIIRELPYPQSNAGPDVSLCYGKTVDLAGTIHGSSFAWSPANTLYKSNTLTPVAGPTTTTTYALIVYDTLTKPNCPKPAISYVTVKVVPPIKAFAGNDTTIVIGQPLQLNATGGVIYTWAPVTGLSNPNIANPIALFNAGVDSITYKVQVESVEHCIGYDDVTVHIFQTLPEIFVPTAFSPNGDGTNDVLRPIVAGMKQFNFFRVYNRWGNMLFSSGNPAQGWDGTFGGTKQQSGTYVYVAQAVDYLGKLITRRGTVVLIR